MRLVRGARKQRAFQIACWTGILLTSLAAFTERGEGNPGIEPASAASPRTIPPNVLLITLCSVRPDHMSCYGYASDTTPNLSALAKEAIVFENAFTQWPKTAPGFAAIITGKYGHANGIMRTTPQSYLEDRHITLTEVLKAAGYQTSAYLSAGAIGKHTNIPQSFNRVRETWRFKHQHVASAKSSLAWLKARDPGRPFFIWAHFNNALTRTWVVVLPQTCLLMMSTTRLARL